MKAKNFDAAFDRNENILKQVDTKNAKRPNAKLRRVNIDFPEWVIAALDRESTRLGVTRQSLVKVWIAERLQEEEKEAA